MTTLFTKYRVPALLCICLRTRMCVLFVWRATWTHYMHSRQKRHAHFHIEMKYFLCACVRLFERCAALACGGRQPRHALSLRLRRCSFLCLSLVVCVCVYVGLVGWRTYARVRECAHESCVVLALFLRARAFLYSVAMPRCERVDIRNLLLISFPDAKTNCENCRHYCRCWRSRCRRI